MGMEIEVEMNMYETFQQYTFKELEKLLLGANTREEKAFYRALLNLKLQIEQEKIVGEILI